MTDVRLYFDTYAARHSTLHEVVEVLQYSYLFGSRCFGQVLRRMKEIGLLEAMP